MRTSPLSSNLHSNPGNICSFFIQIQATFIKFSFKSRLISLICSQIQALLDIQEFYELTLMDENKPNAIKASEAIEMASRWEVGQGPFGKPMGPPGGLNNDTGPDALAMAAAAAAVAQAKKDVCILLTYITYLYY